jgi:hypothetical protein
LCGDTVIGMSNGLTVPFALAVGLSGAVAPAHGAVVAGLAEIAAGSIAMGSGGFLGSTCGERSNDEGLDSTSQRCRASVASLDVAEDEQSQKRDGYRSQERFS